MEGIRRKDKPQHVAHQAGEPVNHREGGAGAGKIDQR